jgi:hypothetical protein
LLAGLPFFETVEPPAGSYAALKLLRLKPGINPKDIRLPALGYAEAARQSWQVFKGLRDSGVIPNGVRFQVSLPTALAVVTPYFVPEAQPVVEPIYERQLLAELSEICRAVPAADLAIQWDVAVEMAIWEGVWPTFIKDLKKGIVERLARLCNAVPRGVELGIHLCYGDRQHQHFKQPADMANLVEVANALAKSVRRPIEWVHMPVPRDRSDDAYYRPLSGLQLPPRTELYLGLVHFTDGIQGTRRRLLAARRVRRAFGLATECGLGRRPPQTIPELLKTHAELADPLG